MCEQKVLIMFSRFLILLILMLFRVSASLADTTFLSVPKSGSSNFEVVRNGKVLGHHRFKFITNQRRLEVGVSAEVEYSLFSIPLYTHSHVATEVWQDGRLISMKATTNDDGERLALSVQVSDDGLIIASPQGREKVPGTTLPASFWNAAMLNSETLFSTLRGGILPIEVEYIGDKVINVKGEPRPTKHYRMTGGVKRDLWFDSADNMSLVYLKFRAKDGSIVEYQLR